MPKQFSRLVDDVHSTFQLTARRVVDSDLFQKPVVISHSEARFIVAEQLAELRCDADIILEPMRRDSATAVAVACMYAFNEDPEALVLVLAADHVIRDVEAFKRAAQVASQAVQQNSVITFGIKPDRAAVEYGYICYDEPSERMENIYRISKFVEKPSEQHAMTLINEGALWNSGYFLFPAEFMMRELQHYAPGVYESAKLAFENSTRDLDFIRLEAKSFAESPKISFDYALMEKTDHSYVMPVSFDWSDVGTWNAVWQVRQQDQDGNSARGRVEMLQTTNSLIESTSDILTTVVGMNNAIVVVTDDAVLVTSMEHSSKVKELVSHLRDKNIPEVDSHKRMYRPWGWYQRIDIGERFQVKRIMVKPGGILSLQKHYHRAEHWVVVKGTAEVTLNDSIILVHENEAIHLPIGSVHRLSNPGKIALELIEVQVGSYTGEDDIVRIEDLYGREKQ